LSEIRAFEHDARADHAVNYVNHAVFNTDGSRFCFFHIWNTPYWAFEHTVRWMTTAPDGSDVRMLDPHSVASHFDWRDPDTVVGWAFASAKGQPEPQSQYEKWYVDGAIRGAYWMFDDRTGTADLFAAGVLPHDGHMSWSPDRRWLVTDESPLLPGNDGIAPLLLFDVEHGVRYEIARFPEPLGGELRCDLHARWSRDGRSICVDSARDGTRQVYVVDVADIVAN
jgi:hypothetical protein